MSKTTFTPEEAAQVVYEYGRKRMAELTKSLRELRERELAKAIVPPHKHTTGTTSSGGIEDIPPGKINPPGKQDVLKEEKSAREESSGEISAEDLSKEELCKKCGKTHDLAKGCDGLDKAMLKDSKGKVKDNGIHPDSVLPEDKDSEEISADGSGGEIKKGKSNDIKKSHAFISDAGGDKHPLYMVGSTKGKCRECGEAISHSNHAETYQDRQKYKDQKTGPQIRKAAQPPMAKPPSGKNMATHVPTSMGKEVKEMVVHGQSKPKPAPKGADFSVKTDGKKTTYVRNVRKEELDKGVMADIARRNSPEVPTQQPAPVPASPTPAQHADRAAEFAHFTPGAGQTGHLMGTPGASANRPGIFGRLGRFGKSETFAKAVPTKTGVTQPRPTLKPAATGMHTVGGPAAMTHMTATAASPDKTAIIPPAPTLPGVAGKVKSNLPRSPVLTPRPALKPAGAGLATAGASTDNTEGDKTAQSLTVGAKPSKMNAVTKPGVLPKV